MFFMIPWNFITALKKKFCTKMCHFLTCKKFLGYLRRILNPLLMQLHKYDNQKRNKKYISINITFMYVSCRFLIGKICEIILQFMFSKFRSKNSEGRFLKRTCYISK